MPIISMSMDEKTLAEVDRLQESLGFSGRSEAMRAGVRKLISENREIGKLSGRVRSVLILVHSEAAEGKATQLKHSFEDVITTQVHSNLEKGKCLQIFVLDGQAERVKGLVRQAQADRKMDYVKLVVP